MSTKFTKKQNDAFMSNLTTIIEQNLQTPNLTNAKLAMMSHMSERQFYRKVESLTGKSPNQYIREVRLQKATELLKSGKFNSVKEIAIRVGFKKVSYFSAIYEKCYGYRPSTVVLQKTKNVF